MNERKFEHTDAGLLLLHSYQFLEFAMFAMEHPHYTVKQAVLKRPMLNNLAVGIELLLKYALVLDDDTKSNALGTTYGHNLEKLWNDCPDRDLQESILSEAEKRASYFRDTSDRSVPARQQIIAMLTKLSDLHRKKGSRLRYPADKDLEAPLPEWLVAVFYSVAEQRCKDHRIPNFLI